MDEFCPAPRMISQPNGVWTRGGGCPKNLVTFVVAIIEDSGRTDAVGFVL
jgi:hypothetical protein